MFWENSTDSGSWERYNTRVYIVEQVLGFIYLILCIYWLIYVIFDILSLLKNKRRLVAIMQYGNNSIYRNKLYLIKENVSRNGVFLMFLIFELIYCSGINAYGFVSLSVNNKKRNVSIGSNCSIESNTFIGMSYDFRSISILLHVISLFANYSFSMMIWLLGASFLHLTFAARNDLRIKFVFHFILLGMILYCVLEISTFISKISLFCKIIHDILDQVSFFLVIYIAKIKFFPAMNSRVLDAYHLHDIKVYFQQKRLLRQYKVLAFVLLFTFEIYILKNVFIYNFLLIFEFLSSNLCWFNVTFNIPVFRIPDITRYTLNQLSGVCSVIGHVIDILVLFNFIVVNLNITYVTTKRMLKTKLVEKSIYRYRIFSASLLSDYN